MKKLLSQTTLGDMDVSYFVSEDGSVELVLMPSGTGKDEEAETKSVLPPQGAADSLVQLKIEGDAYPYGFANGCTMRNSESVRMLKYSRQTIETKAGQCRIRTVLTDGERLEAEHILTYWQGDNALCLSAAVTNCGSEALAIEMLSSFSLSGLKSPMSEESDLFLHRIRSKWSGEGMCETRTIEELQLVPAWSGWGAKSEKYFQTGSMPVRGYYPFGAVEDRRRGIVWAAQLAIPGSWQMEAYRRDENLCLSGGLADYDTGHWMKILKPGEGFVSPEALVTVTKSSFDIACQRLVQYQKKKTNTEETVLPVIFNEFCTTWGCPKEENISRILEAVRDWDIDCFVIDAGWYADEEKGWESNMGDWKVSDALFPHGIRAVADKIHGAGMKAGIWFEPEVAGRDAEAFQKEEHLLKKHGKVITSGARRFWDMRQEQVRDYLSSRITDFLKKYGFDYIKADYNESIGIGCDGAESLGEGLRLNMEAAGEFYRELRREIPDLKIEICSSGGHRQEPSMIGLADYVSFSDAHEEKEIPVIAANLHRVMPPEKTQIWAVLRKEDSLKRIVYSMNAAMFGVVCLSGDVFKLNEQQNKIVKKGIQFYRKISYIIKEGITEYFGTVQQSYRRLHGWQAVVQYDKSGDALAVIHTFEEHKSGGITVPLRGRYRVLEVYSDTMRNINLSESGLTVRISEGFASAAIWLRPEAARE